MKCCLKYIVFNEKMFFFFFLLRHLKLTNFRAVIAVTKHCETVIFLLKVIIPTKFHTGTCLITRESLALQLACIYVSN